MNTGVYSHEPDLLVRPAPGRREGPCGYLLRLAEANCMTLNELKQLGGRYEPAWLNRNRLLPDALLDPDLYSHVGRMSWLFQDKGRIWNQRHARFCPVCLAEDPTWRASWEIVFHDVCPHHGVWLVDHCSSCGQPISWNRDTLLRCQCGSDLRQELPGSAPDNVRRLAAALEARLLGKDGESEWPVLAGLNLEQMQRLVRYLGGYMDPVAGPKPLKLRNASSLQASWPVSTLAAEILSQWPQSFYDCWSKMQDLSGGDKVGLKGLFKQAHSYLYKGLKEGAFVPIREAFESWLSEHWRGGLCKRNRNLAEQLLAQAKWIPGKVAVERLGISSMRLRGLIRDGHLDGQESISTTGRRFFVVRRDQLDQIDAQLANEMTMTEAMEVLGVGKVRMRRIFKLLFPTVRRIDDRITMPWCVSRNEVDSLLALGEQVPTIAIPDENQVSLAHVLRYWAWTTDEVVALIEATRTGKLKLQSKLDSGKGITRWVFDVIPLRAWHTSLGRGQGIWLTIPEVASFLGIKQQVVYWLAQNGYLQSEKLGTSKGLGSRVKRVEVDRFRAAYVFATELAQVLGRSPLKIMRMLASQGIYQLRGHSVDPCRQLIYVRNEEIGRFMRQFSGTPPPDFQLVGSTEDRK